jgi:hypothetical protein
VKEGMVRHLGTIDPATAVITAVGVLLDNLAGIAFAANGTLYGVTGDGGMVGETLFTVSTVDASTTLVVALGAGTDGETIAFNSTDGLMYHASGLGSHAFDSIDLVTLAVTPITLTDDTYSEILAMTWDPVGSVFLVADLDLGWFSATTTGTFVSLGGSAAAYKGLAFAP